MQIMPGRFQRLQARPVASPVGLGEGPLGKRSIRATAVRPISGMSQNVYRLVMKTRLSLVAAGIGLCIGAAGLHATNYEYDNSPVWVYSDGINGQAPFLQPFTDPDVVAIGQTFRLLSGSLGITSVGMWINTPASNSLDLRLYLAEWDDANARIGTLLQQWEGPDHIQGISFPHTAAGFLNFKFDSEAPVPANDFTTYVLFATINDLSPADPATAKFGFHPGVHLPTGNAVFGTGTSLAHLAQQSWTAVEGDLAFSVAFFDGTPPFSAVPEPAVTGSVAAAALIGLLISRHISRRKKAAPMAST